MKLPMRGAEHRFPCQVFRIEQGCCCREGLVRQIHIVCSTKSYGNSSSNTGIALSAFTVVEVFAMLWTLFAILLILWLLGWGFHIAGALIHVLLVIALLLLIVNLVRGDTAT